MIQKFPFSFLSFFLHATAHWLRADSQDTCSAKQQYLDDYGRPDLRTSCECFMWKITKDTVYTTNIKNWYDMMIWYDIFVNCNWVVTRWQQYSTHLHKNNTQNDTKQTIHRTTQQFWKRAGRALSWLVIPWHLPYNRGKRNELFQEICQYLVLRSNPTHAHW